jgi:hypothetical protein
MDVEHRMLELLALLDPPVPKRFLAQAADYVGHGESTIAFEDLCENIYEVGARLTATQTAAIADVAGLLGVRDHRWRFVLELEQS